MKPRTTLFTPSSMQSPVEIAELSVRRRTQVTFAGGRKELLGDVWTVREDANKALDAEWAGETTFHRETQIEQHKWNGETAIGDREGIAKLDKNNVSNPIDDDEDRIIAALAKGVDVTDIFSPARVATFCAKFGLVPGTSMDLTTGWERRQAMQDIETNNPMVVMGAHHVLSSRNIKHCGGAEWRMDARL